ncbi:uncharacterized protein BXIN_1254 [Babesia sp. Xinjiang]|uniref:uncharacterized protein n=1 Tax=Babesia sp. Xinjiang TaxID=462227 RepID=UPI000A2364DF|nr:uncharacterized protein BXIN_1254 [Babesia sp. Xinjiang]ORM39982.1 hypothetical protein BXIN_1254 [Babesia sp. Xinjiang]
MQKWTSLQGLESISTATWCMYAICICLLSIKLRLYCRRFLVVLLASSLAAYGKDGARHRIIRCYRGTYGVRATGIGRNRQYNMLLSRSIGSCGPGNVFYHTAFAYCKGLMCSKARQCQINRHSEPLKATTSEDGSVDTDNKAPADAKHPLSSRKAGRKRRGGSKLIDWRLMPKPFTIADVIKKRLIPQPPSLKETQKVLERKPWKRMGIPNIIKQEKQKIEETDLFLDNYFYSYLLDKGTNARLHSGVKSIDESLFKNKTVADDPKDPMKQEPQINKYNAEELLQIWDTKGGHFYTNIPKTVAMFQIIRRIAKESHCGEDMLKRFRDHECFKRLVGSVVRHMKYVTRIELPRHLKDYKKLLDMVPRFSREQLVTIFSVLSYFGYKHENVLKAMLQYAKRYEDFTTDEMSAIIMASIKMGADPSQMVGDYITKLKSEIKKAESKVDGEDHLKYYLDVLRICNKTDHMDNELFKHIAEYFKKQESIPLGKVVNAIWLFTGVQHMDEPLYKHLYGLLAQNIGLIKGKEMVIRLVTCLANCHFKPPKNLVDHLSSFILDDIKSYSLVELTAALRNLAIMDCYMDDLYRKVFSLDLFMNPPSVKVLQQINLQLNQKKSAYAAYLQPTVSSTLNVVFGNTYHAYLGYQLLSGNLNKFELPKDAVVKLKDIYTSGVKHWTFNSSAFHIQVKDILNEAFGIECEVEHVTNDGLVVDIAILPSSLAKYTEKIGAKDFLKDKRCAIEVHGPYHYLQKSTDVFPPPLNNSTLYKERLLNARGWDVVRLHYWSLVPWMKHDQKIKVLESLLPQWVKNACNIPENDRPKTQIAPS